MTKQYKVLLTKKAQSQLSKLEKATAARIITKLEYFEKSENPFLHAKKLTDNTLGEYRFRVGNYRIIFDVDGENEVTILLIILAVKHRKEAYI